MLQFKYNIQTGNNFDVLSKLHLKFNVNSETVSIKIFNWYKIHWKLLWDDYNYVNLYLLMHDSSSSVYNDCKYLMFINCKQYRVYKKNAPHSLLNFTNKLKDWNIFHVKGWIHNSVWSTTTFFVQYQGAYSKAKHYVVSNFKNLK